DGSLRFFIDTLKAYECGFFTISTMIDCNVEFGITQCSKAEIFPPSTCEPEDPAWDKSSVKVTGKCIGDSSVCFQIFNTGEQGGGAMAGTSEWRLYEDGILVQSGQFQLDGQETLELCFDANGHTLKLAADQRPGHPGNSHPNDIIEACGPETNEPIVPAASFPEDDIDGFVEYYCNVIRASYDPNEKIAMPLGRTDEHFIDPNLQMEYTIHFQNMGNDTAYLVVVQDTMPAELDLESISSGSSSHPYSFRIKENRLVEWRFENIMLVDSATNEPASKGYVKFKINQVANLPHRTEIRNRAFIYFDFNEAVITEFATSTIWDSVGVNAVQELNTQFGAVRIYPNPGKEKLFFEFEQKDQYQLQITNLLGQVVQRAVLEQHQNPVNIHALREGSYIYQITDSQGRTKTGKFIKIN
ncbi:MAG: T9SS type A sorting domain-containing protein, partial [Bacteroidetes bacterium]